MFACIILPRIWRVVGRVVDRMVEVFRVSLPLLTYERTNRMPCMCKLDIGIRGGGNWTPYTTQNITKNILYALERVKSRSVLCGMVTYHMMDEVQAQLRVSGFPDIQRPLSLSCDRPISSCQTPQSIMVSLG